MDKPFPILRLSCLTYFHILLKLPKHMGFHNQHVCYQLALIKVQELRSCHYTQGPPIRQGFWGLESGWACEIKVRLKGGEEGKELGRGQSSGGAGGSEGGTVCEELQARVSGHL